MTQTVSPRHLAVWGALGLCTIGPVALAAVSPLLAWRDPIYVAAGFAGVVSLSLLLLQPLLTGGWLPGLARSASRKLHRWVGATLVLAVLIHVAGLWVTSPPDVLDALLFRSPTPFAVWGVLAMWAVIGAAGLAATRRGLRLKPKTWARAHRIFAAIIVGGTMAHAVLIEGTMETISKVVLCGLVVVAASTAVIPIKTMREGLRAKTAKPR